jgi:hypothetical protein
MNTILISYIANNSDLTESEKTKLILDELVKANGDNVTSILLRTLAIKEEKIKLDEKEHYRALSDLFMLFSNLSQQLTENKTSHKAKNFLKMVLKDRCVELLTPILKILNKDGRPFKVDYSSCKWVFGKFSKAVKAQYKDLEKWATRQDYIDYLNKVKESKEEQ